jgi:hypothetical protein
MPYRLKSRTQSPPNGFLYRQALTGWENFKVCPSSQWDFQLLCNELQKHRMSNPKYKLSTDMTAIQNEVDAKNAERVAAMPGGDIYVVSTDVPASFHQAPTRSSPVLAAVKAISVGAATINDFMDSGESPVSQEVAESRAAVCVACPLNEKGDLSRFFTIPAAERIRKQIEAKEGRGLKTSQDGKLHVCSACMCPLVLKQWFPLAFIVKHMSDDIKAQLDAACWIRKESNALPTPKDLEN